MANFDGNSGMTDVKQGSIQPLVNKATYSVSLIRLTDYARGLKGYNFFGPNSILPSVISIEVKDSLGQFFKTGRIILADQSSLREFLPLTGNEVIAIKYKNQVSSGSTGSKISYFSIFSVEEVDGSQEGRSGNKFLALTLVEFPAYTMLCNSSGYVTFKDNTTTISNAVDTILQKIPYINLYYNLQKSEITKGEINFWVPQNWTPLKALTYLQKYALNTFNDPLFGLNTTSASAINDSAAYKLPEMSFCSIYSLARQNNRTYSTQRSDTKFRDSNTAGGSQLTPSQNKPNARDDKDNAPCDVILFKKSTFHDSSASYAGLNGDTYVGRDQEGATYFCKTYEEFLRNYRSFGFWSAFPTGIRNGWGNQWSNVNLTHITNKHKGQMEGLLINSYAEKILLGASRMSMVCYLSEFRNPGETANLYLPNGDKDKNGLDLMMGGPWMTWSITDRITANGEAFSEIELARDSFYIVDGVSNYLPKMTPGIDKGLPKF